MVAVEFGNVVPCGQKLIKLAHTKAVVTITLQRLLQHGLHAVVVAIFEVHINIGIEACCPVPLMHILAEVFILQVGSKTKLLLILEQQIAEHMEQNDHEGAVEETCQRQSEPFRELGYCEILGSTRGQGKQNQITVQQKIRRADS